MKPSLADRPEIVRGFPAFLNFLHSCMQEMYLNCLLSTIRWLVWGSRATILWYIPESIKPSLRRWTLLAK
jgi:hypothetical protein